MTSQRIIDPPHQTAPKRKGTRGSFVHVALGLATRYLASAINSGRPQGRPLRAGSAIVAAGLTARNLGRLQAAASNMASDSRDYWALRILLTWSLS